MEKELRNYGDGRTIVLHTKDSHVYRKFRDSVKVIGYPPITRSRTARMF